MPSSPSSPGSPSASLLSSPGVLIALVALASSPSPPSAGDFLLVALVAAVLVLVVVLRLVLAVLARRPHRPRRRRRPAPRHAISSRWRSMSRPSCWKAFWSSSACARRSKSSPVRLSIEFAHHLDAGARGRRDRLAGQRSRSISASAVCSGTSSALLGAGDRIASRSAGRSHAARLSRMPAIVVLAQRLVAHALDRVVSRRARSARPAHAARAARRCDGAAAARSCRQSRAPRAPARAAGCAPASARASHLPCMRGRSAVQPTSASGSCAMARAAPVSASLKRSRGDSSDIRATFFGAA